MRICMATVSIGGSLQDKIEAIAAAGFDSLELLDDDLARSGLAPEEFARRCADLGLGVDLYQPFRRAEAVSDEEYPQVLKRFHAELEVMSRAGARAILVVSNTDEDALASRDVTMAQLAGLADAAAEHGMTVMFEALAWGTHISRVAQAREVVQVVDHPALSLVVDTFHQYAGGEDSLGDLTGAEVGFLQVADAPRLSLELKQWSRNHRCFPGEGEFDLAGPVAALLKSGYQGPLSLEIFNPGYRERSPYEVSRQGAEALRRFTGSLGVAL
ncbi:sugar phosphate isomerase/epimerase family protein [Kineosporia babensis]|uniref:Sugar phosphate isomerase/epimerase n=1 Tax=Kineosporia babensis TaxID=499548 RepID=A0A9X1SWK9_9ACTN|nr:sugar phosphate isomerase/epimerase family protein [Kineosporia babensis]MCD5314891.1 sugar phosphate isomerase/epimerase [Kineosporia babensis]